MLFADVTELTGIEHVTVLTVSAMYYFIVSEMTYNVSMGTLNPTIHTYIFIFFLIMCPRFFVLYK